MLVLLGILILPRFFGVDSSICHLNCVIRVFNGTDHCNSSTGQCLYGCQPGYAGPNCTFVCSSHCEPHVVNETETCNDTTGECLYGCQSGYAGSNCSVECPHTCASRGVRDAEICNATSKECLYGCQDGYYGARCDNECDSAVKYCKRCSLQSDHSVICDECIHNSYRYNGKCTACNYWCMVNVSSPLPVCREKDGYCVHGCKTGRYGFICGDKCEQCKDRCDRDLGHCLTGCLHVGYCGPTCEIACNDGCSPRDCDRSCTCRLGCIRTKWGHQCDKFCNDNCNEPADLNSNICERSNGSCSYKCKNDTIWGSQCEKNCSSYCNGGICEQSTGKCTGGCNSKEVYGIGCDKACNKNCFNGTCERADGKCDSGCVKGWYGDQCNFKCSDYCLNRKCSRTGEHCEDGCVEGRHGDQCEEICSLACLNRICDRKTGACDKGRAETCSVFCVQATSGSSYDNVTGDCLLGCQSGYAGSKCNIQCCSNCQDCSLSQGSATGIVCNECAKDYYKSGSDCQPCSEMCARNDSSSLSVCRQTDGRCEFGCKPGFYNDLCNEKCSVMCNNDTCDEMDGSCSNGCTLPVVTGPKCMDSCSPGCVNRECNQDGTCKQGCTPHFWDSDCRLQCSATCFRPVDIDSRICNQTNGHCLHGCVNGTYWESNCSTECSSTCVNRKCDFVTGNCVD